MNTAEKFKAMHYLPRNISKKKYIPWPCSIHKCYQMSCLSFHNNSRFFTATVFIFHNKVTWIQQLQCVWLHHNSWWIRNLYNKSSMVIEFQQSIGKTRTNYKIQLPYKQSIPWCISHIISTTLQVKKTDMSTTVTKKRNFKNIIRIREQNYTNI